MQKPAPVYGLTPGRMDVFWCARDKSSVMQTWFDGSSWQTAAIAQGDVPFGFAPAVYDNAPGKMDVGWTDRVGKIWYTSLDGGHWTPPVELNPSNMTGAKWVQGSNSNNWSPPMNFAACSPLADCPNPSYRRSQNTEFLVGDNQNNVWDLLLDNGTWTVSQMALDDRMAFMPAQVIARIYTDSPQPHLIWCDKDGKLRVSYMLPAMFTQNAWSTPQSISKYFESRSSPQFSAADFWNSSNVDGLVTIIKVQPDPEYKVYPDPLSAYLWPRIKSQLTDQQGILRPDLGDALARAFNSLCAGPSLYDKARFARVRLRKATRILLAQNPQGGEDLQRLNRMLLEDGYDGYIVRCLTYMGGVAFQLGVLAGLTPGRVDIFWASLSPGAVMQTVWDGTNWSTNKIMDRYMPDGELVPVSGLSSGRIDLFCLNKIASGKMNLDNIWWSGGGWSKTTIAQDLSEDNPPAAIYNPAQGRIYVFWASEDSKLWSISSDGTTWTTPVELGSGPMMRKAVMPAPEAIYGYAPGRMDVIYGGADKNVKQASGDGTTWNSVMLNPAEMVAAQGCPVSVDPPILSFLWLNTIGEVLYEWFNGTWHITKLDNQVGGKFLSIGSSPLGKVFAINDAGQLCKVDYQLGIGGSIQPAIIDLPYPGYTGPFAPPTVFNPRFAPAVTDGVNIYLCDNNLLLCEVTEQWSSVNPVKTGSYAAKNVQYGPLAYAPVAVGMSPFQLGHGSTWPGAFVFWCAKENTFLMQTWYGNYSTWQSYGIAPGPMATGPAKLLLPNGEVHLFWGALDGTLKHMWAILDQIGGPNDPWQHEVMDSVEMGSPPVAIWNAAQGQIYVFWLDYDGQLKQTWLNPPNPGLPKWRTVTIAPATSASMVWRDL